MEGGGGGSASSTPTLSDWRSNHVLDCLYHLPLPTFGQREFQLKFCRTICYWAIARYQQESAKIG